MAYKTTTFSGSKGSSPTLNYNGTVKITRASTTTKKVTVEVECKFSLNSGGFFSANYDLKVWGDSGGTNDNYGWASKVLMKSGSSKWSSGTTKTVNWSREFELIGDQLTWKMYFTDGTDGTHNIGSKTSPAISKVCTVPTYSSSSGGGDSGGGIIAVYDHTITNVSFSSSPIYLGAETRLDFKVNKGENNTISEVSIYDNIARKTVYSNKNISSTTNFSVPVTPESTSTAYKYTIKVISPYTDTVTKNASLVVNSFVAYIYDASISPTKVNRQTGGDVKLTVDTNTKTASGSDDCFIYSINGSDWTKDYLFRTISVNSGDVITVKAYDERYDVESSSSKTIRVSGYDPVSINSINIVPEVLKDNTGPDLVNIIKEGNVSTFGSGTISWYYRQSNTDLSSASWQSLGVSGSSSFSNLDMTQKVDKGNFYQIRAIITGTDNTDYADSNTYRIPNNPRPATITEVIPKADPEHGYTVMEKDGKTYYGSGLFAIWKEQDVDDSRLEIAERELIYQSRSSSSSSFNEIKVAQLKYKKVLRADGTLELYPLSASSGFLYGGGDDLETESLQETRIGVRVTDILGQTSDVFWQEENFYKAESPGFGGNLVVNFDEFRPFTADPNGVFNFSSSVAQSNSQDVLYYYINCWIGERKCEVEILKNIPISYQEFISATTDTILYSDDNIKIKKQKADTLYYEVKNSYLSNLFLSKPELREVKNSLEDKFNNDFTDVVYKIYVKDDFDASSTRYNSRIVAVKFIERPILSHNSDVQMGVNRYTNSINPFYGNDGETPIVLVNNLSNNNDRMVNPSEGVIFKFKPARDYNGLDYKTTMRGDVVGYNIYVSRNDEPVVSNYDKLNYTLLKYYPVEELKKAKPNDSNDEYYYLEYPLISYQESKFTVFKIEAVDSKGNKSDFIYSNTYLVPCRAQSMDFYINNVRIEKGLDNNYTIAFKIKVNDFGASIFVNNTYGYDKENEAYAFPNYERRFTVSGNQFSPKGYLILEASLDGDFNNKGTVELKKEETGGTVSQTFDNYFNLSIDLASQLAGRRYPDIIEIEQPITNFPTQWIDGIENKFVKKIFFKATYEIAYGFKDIEKTDFKGKYLVVESVSAPYSYYEDAPTVSYRNHQVGINTKDFSANSTEGQKEVLIIQDNGSYNLVVFKGAEQRITINLTDRTISAITSDNKEVILNFNTGFIDGMTIDGGNW